MRLLVLVIVATLLALGASSARAATPEADPVRGWVGRYCTPAGCAGTHGSPAAHAAGFAAATAATMRLARRRRA